MINPLSAMSGIYDITPWALRTAVNPDTVKIMKKTLTFSCKSLKFSTNFRYLKKKAQKKALALKGFRHKEKEKDNKFL